MTYQYTYNHNVFAVDYMPVVYFSYHIGGLVVDIREDGMHFGMFLIRLCAIVGGTYTLASFVDHALDRFIDRKKQY